MEPRLKDGLKYVSLQMAHYLSGTWECLQSWSDKKDFQLNFSMQRDWALMLFCRSWRAVPSLPLPPPPVLGPLRHWYLYFNTI